MNSLSSLNHFFFPHHSNNQRAKLLHPSSLLVVAGFFIVFQLILRQTATSFPEVLGYASNIPASEIIRLTNIERQNRNLPTLRLDEKLSEAASKKAADMFNKNYWAHVAPDGTQPWSFINTAGYSYRYAGENLARDFTNSEAVVKAWIASPSHKDNLLSSRYQDIGVAVVDGKLDGKETTLVVQMFGTKLSAQAKPPAGSRSRTTQLSPGNLVPKVRAETSENQDINASVSKFTLNKNFVLILLAIFVGVLVIDIVMVYKRSLTRWTSKSLAHLVFVGAVLIAVFGILQGQVI